MKSELKVFLLTNLIINNLIKSIPVLTYKLLFCQRHEKNRNYKIL